jgi:hypothetical protein
MSTVDRLRLEFHEVNGAMLVNAAKAASGAFGWMSCWTRARGRTAPGDTPWSRVMLLELSSSWMQGDITGECNGERHRCESPGFVENGSTCIDL